MGNEIENFHKNVVKSLFDIVESGLNVDDIDFDLYAQHVDEWNDLRKIFPSILVKSAGGLLPYEMIGWIKEYPFSFRTEWGYAYLRIAEKNANIHTGPYFWEAKIDVPDIELNKNLIISYFVQTIENLHTARFKYDFLGNKLKSGLVEGRKTLVPSDEKEVFSAWGETPEEAYEALNTPSVNISTSPATQREWFQMRDISKTPLNSDSRRIPEKPDWYVE